MKKRVGFYLVVTLLVLVEITSVFLMCKSLSDKPTLDDVKLKEINNKDAFAIMLGDKNGVYTESDSNTWPSNKSYTYNSERSGCIDKDGNKIENALTFNSTTNIATVSVSETSYCYLYFDIDSTVPVISSVTKTSNEQTSISISVSASDSNGIEKYYYSINESEYEESNSNTYTFSSLTAGTTYTIKVYVTDSVGNQSEVNTQTFSTNICESGTLVGTCLQDNPTMGLNTTMEAELYRFQGTDVNNYVCFGTSDKSTCTGNTDTYMYRIIGINSSGQLRLIKNEALNSTMQWYSDYTTNITWPQSTIYSNINGGSFLTSTAYVPSSWSDKIATTTWKYGDNTTDDTTAASLYSIENEWTSTISAKIGLMYLHDYYYAYQSGGLNCGNSEIYTTCINAWIHLSKCDSGAPKAHEWTMSRYGFNDYTSYLAWFVSGNGDGYWHALHASNAVRPTFYLTLDVQYVSGTGTSTDPFILE